MKPVLSPQDQVLASLDGALRTLFAKPHASRPTPTSAQPQPQPLTPTQARHAAGLMRVNHAGEICAQALYTAQALNTQTPQVREQLLQAAREETDHLAWTGERLAQLGSHPSWLNPLWYAGAFGLGLLAGRLGDSVSLGFVMETEIQVEAHLASHLQEGASALAPEDVASRAIVQQMQIDERAHHQAAHTAGGHELPAFIKNLMTQAARVMTRTAYHL